MILSDKTLKRLIGTGELVIDPLEPGQIQPASVDIRLGTSFLKVDEHTVESISMDKPANYIPFESNEVIIPPHSFLLGTTLEYFKLPSNMTAFVEGRSSVGRMGLFIQNAGWIDPGFEGEVTLELYNANSVPIKLNAGRRICQMVFAFMDQEAENPYRGKYQGQRKATGSMIYKDIK